MTIELYDATGFTSLYESDDNEDLVEHLDRETVIDDYSEVPPREVITYNELRSCADLHRMYKDDTLDISPDFQRDVVWNAVQQSRFIDSLVKQLPIPSMCIAYDNREQKRIIIDGLQRITAIINFLDAGDWKMSKSEGINRDIAGKTARDIYKGNKKLRSYYQRVENVVLPINVLRCDFKKSAHMRYIFTIFHRLNAGGIRLNNQEIRNCIYGGKFNDLLKELDKDVNWRRINRMTKSNSCYRFMKQEIILRFFAFNDSREKYNGKFAKFLNDYMHRNQSPSDKYLDDKRKLFTRVVSLFANSVFPNNSPEKRIPTSVIESTLVAIAQNIDVLEVTKQTEVKKMYEILRHSTEFMDAALAEGLAKTDKVQARFDAAIKVFNPK